MINIQTTTQNEEGEYHTYVNYDEIKCLPNGKKVYEDMFDVLRNVKNVHWPDLLIQDKGGNIKFVEVKSFDADIKNTIQKRTLEALGRKGYKVSQMNLPINAQLASLLSEDTRKFLIETVKDKNYNQNEKEKIIINWNSLDDTSKKMGIGLGICPDEYKSKKEYNQLRMRILAIFNKLEQEEKVHAKNKHL